MDLIADFATELEEIAGLTPEQSRRLSHEMVRRGWINLRRIKSICARRRFDRLLKAGYTIENARVDIEARYDLTEATSRMLIYREKKIR